MEKQITTFLTFQENNAEEAMNFYYGKNGPAKEGSVMIARFELNGGYIGYFSDPDGHLWELVYPQPQSRG